MRKLFSWLRAKFLAVFSSILAVVSAILLVAAVLGGTVVLGSASFILGITFLGATLILSSILSVKEWIGEREYKFPSLRGLYPRSKHPMEEALSTGE